MELPPLEAFAVVFSAASVWLLSRNLPLGWWVGLAGVTLYGVVFYRVRLYAEVAIQVFYFVTSLQAIWIWLKGGAGRTEKPVGRASRPLIVATVVLGVVSVLALREGLIAIGGAVPFWDATTTVLSLIAHLYLMARYVDSWYVWIAVDCIYIPMYASRGLYVTSGLYAVFLVLAVQGLLRFRELYEARAQA